MVPKNDGSWRPCSDTAFKFGDNPRQVSFTKYARPFQWLHGYTIFSKIDLVKGYHQIPVATEDIPKTAIITTFGL